MHSRGLQQGVLYRFFAGLTEFTFQSRLGMADPAVLEYISGLLTRFVHCDAIYAVRSLQGRRLDQVADMLVEAEQRVGEARRQVHRHIGDYTLFWTGMFPEAVTRFQRELRQDALLNYKTQGKRAYLVASSIQTDTYAAENEVLERLSHEFDLCAYGLSEVRREWEKRNDGDPTAPRPPIVLE